MEKLRYIGVAQDVVPGHYAIVVQMEGGGVQSDLLPRGASVEQVAGMLRDVADRLEINVKHRANNKPERVR